MLKPIIRFSDDPHPEAVTFLVKGFDPKNKIVQAFMVDSKDLESAPETEEHIWKLYICPPVKLECQVCYRLGMRDAAPYLPEVKVNG